MRRFLAVPVVLAAALLCRATPVSAHEVRPAYLELRELGAERFAVLWKVPTRGEARLSLAVRFPAKCAVEVPVARADAGGALTERWQIACPGGLDGESIQIDGLEDTLTDALVRLERANGTTQVTRLSPTARSFVVDAVPSRFAVAATYLTLGAEHIWFGFDHLLFVLGLLILVEGRRNLIGTITAFTVAHSITLAAATLGWVRLAPQPVEAVIALSIVFVASEIAREQQGESGWTRRWPWLVAFSFGLLHGFGFAGALRETGLPANAIPLALFFFNVGVEIGQLVFIAVAMGLLAALDKRNPSPALRAPTRRATAYGIGVPAAFWTIERVAAFWR